MSSEDRLSRSRASKFSQKATERLRVLEKVHPIARMDHRNLYPKGEVPFQSFPRKERRKIERNAARIASKYNRLMKSLISSGTQYPNSNFLRSLAIEYNHRYASAGVSSQPVSFNYLEPFIKVSLIEECAPCVKLRPEANQLFYVPDFIEFVTSEYSTGFEYSSLLGLPEGKIFHFSPNGGLTDFTYLVADQREFLISGFSLVRYGDSLHWMMLGGEIYEKDIWEQLETPVDEALPVDLDPYKRKFLEEAMARNGSGGGKPLPIDGHDSAHHTILLATMDLNDGTYSTKCLMRDFENSYQILTDDAGIFGPQVSDEQVSSILDAADAEFNRTAVMWGLGTSFLQLPEYFAIRLAVNKKDFVSSEGSIRGVSAKLGQGISGKFQAIKSLELIDGDDSSVKIVKVVPPHFKELASATRKPIIDENSESLNPPVFVKETIKSAASKIEEVYSNLPKEVSDGREDRGVLYIMRCMGMQEQIYKVGYTDRSAKERAKELSASTSATNAFAVVKNWSVENPKQFETNIHAMLDPYRWNKKREYFSIPSEKLIAIIEEELHRLGLIG